MTKKALCLSGGGAKGSFQMGAIRCLYEVYGFRPDLLVTTSVGSVNGIKLAEAAPPAVNDADLIRTSGQIDDQLQAMRALEQMWLGFDSPDKFFVVRQPFRATMIEEVARGLNTPGYEDLQIWEMGRGADILTWLLRIPLVNKYLAPILHQTTEKVGELADLLIKVFTEDAFLALDPIESMLRASSNLDLDKVAVGTPLYMAVVSLETGRLRYVRGTGEFVERDGRSPVASALSPSDIDNALDAAGAPLSAERRAGITNVLNAYAGQMQVIKDAKAEGASEAATPARRKTLLGEIAVARSRGAHALAVLQIRLGGVQIRASVDRVAGVLASACMPGYFLPPNLGLERYVDGGVREVLPTRLALDLGATELVAIQCSAIEGPVTDSMVNVGVPSVLARALTETVFEELVEGDIAPARQAAIPACVIIPSFNVHEVAVVQPSLIEISMHYGWMRVADECHPGDEAARAGRRLLSDTITRLRLAALQLEREVRKSTSDTAIDPNAVLSATRADYFRLRVVRWAIHHAELTRLGQGLPRHERSINWAIEWEREMRGNHPSGFSSVWDRLEVADGVVIWRGSSPSLFAPDVGCVIDEPSGSVYWLVRGAAFLDPDSSLARGFDFLLPTGAAGVLPKVPAGTHVISTVDDPARRFLVTGGRRYLVTPSQLAFVQLTAGGVAIVPRDGHLQIPDGGEPFFLGNLVVVDELSRPLMPVSFTRVEGGTSWGVAFVKNRGPNPIAVVSVTLDLPSEAGVTVESVPRDLLPNEMKEVVLNIAPSIAGRHVGSLMIDCDDPEFPRLRVPMEVTVTPLGAAAELSFEPGVLNMVARVGAGGSMSIATENTGAQAPSEVSWRIAEGAGRSFFSLGSGLPSAADLAPGVRRNVMVFFQPADAIAYESALEVEYSGTSSSGSHYLRTARLPLAGLGQAPRIRLTRNPRSPIDRPTLTSLDTLVNPDTLVTGVLHGKEGSTSLTIDVGRISAPTSEAGSFYVHNDGNVVLKVTSIGLDNLILQSLGTTQFPIEIAPRHSLRQVIDVGLTHMPPVGPLKASLFIQSDDPLTPQAVVTVIGIGAGPGPLAKVVPEYIDFGSVPVTTMQERVTLLRNLGTSDLTVRVAKFRDGRFFTAAFQSALPFTIPSGQDIDIKVTFGPVSGADFYGDTLDIHIDDLPKTLGLVVQVKAE